MRLKSSEARLIFPAAIFVVMVVIFPPKSTGLISGHVVHSWLHQFSGVTPFHQVYAILVDVNDMLQLFIINSD